MTTPTDSIERQPLELSARGNRRADRLFSWLARGSGTFVVLLVTGVGAFLLYRAVPALLDNQANFFTDRVWDTETPAFGIPDLFYTTVLSSVFAMALAVPVAIGIALFITEYAPKRLAMPVAYIVDLLAAVPSIIFGLWGITVLAPKLEPVRNFLTDTLGWIPIFGETRNSVGTVFTAGVVLAIMILPIVAAISREVFAKTPDTHKEAAFGLGSTQWEMIRMTVIPFGRPGVISGAMLGLGRALGETIAVLIIISRPNSNDPFNLSLFFGGETFASRIANNAAEFDTPRKTGVYIAAGLVLFVLTFAVNAIARYIINRRKEFTE